MLSSCCTLVFEKAQQNFRRLVRKRRQAFVRLSDKGIGFLEKGCVLWRCTETRRNDEAKIEESPE